MSEQDQVEELTEILRAAKPAVVVRALRRAYPTVYWPGPSEWRRADFDLDLLEKLAALGVTVQEAASFFGVSRSTMNRRLREPAYRRAWDRGQVNVKIALRRAQLQRALEGSDTMLIWLWTSLVQKGPAVHPVQLGDHPAALTTSRRRTAAIRSSRAGPTDAGVRGPGVSGARDRRPPGTKRAD